MHPERFAGLDPSNDGGLAYAAFLRTHPEIFTDLDRVDAILGGLASGAAQVYVPEYFREICTNKAQDVGAFIEGTATYLRNQREAG